MNVAITGHTSGIGLSIANYFWGRGDTVLGYSRSNGYNINDSTTRKKIVDSAADCKIFVNNAYNNFDNSQEEMLRAIFNQWRDRGDRLIINISTRWTKDDHPYCLTKRSLDKFCEDNLYSKPAILNLKPGWIDTPRVLQFKKQKMPADVLVKLLDYAICNWPEQRISSITFGI